MQTPLVGEDQPRQRRSILRMLFFPLLLIKVGLRKTLLLLFLGLRGVFHYRVSSSLVGLLLVALILTNMREQPAAPVAASAVGNNSLTPPATVESYIKGQSTFNARLMWGAMSDQFQQGLTSQGGSPEGLQQQLDAAQGQGRLFRDVKYVAGYQLGDGRGVYLYVITMEANGQSHQVPYTFTVGQSGKIDSVD